uniref:Uncharacterized protein n=1 Tax=Timema bartmani TaxID=61472 RepID=A0A7R9HZY4_9NEOP|nr:unnamed protein product [Timema bartmani]
MVNMIVEIKFVIQEDTKIINTKEGIEESEQSTVHEQIKHLNCEPEPFMNHFGREPHVFGGGSSYFGSHFGHRGHAYDSKAHAHQFSRSSGAATPWAKPADATGRRGAQFGKS